jgi:hypothetical protein
MTILINFHLTVIGFVRKYRIKSTQGYTGPYVSIYHKVLPSVGQLGKN